MSSAREILVVDDDPDICETVGALLEADGHHVRTADNGAVALAKIAEHMPDLVLLDVRMPVMDGIEVHRRLRSAEATRRLPVVVMSAFADLDDVVAAFGIEQKLKKPFDVEDLHAAVENATRGRA